MSKETTNNKNNDKQSQIIELKKQLIEVAEKLAKIEPVIPSPTNNCFDSNTRHNYSIPFLSNPVMWPDQIEVSIKNGRYTINAEFTLDDYSKVQTPKQQDPIANRAAFMNQVYGGGISPYPYGSPLYTSAYGDDPSPLDIITADGSVANFVGQIELMRFTNNTGVCYWTDPNRIISKFTGVEMATMRSMPIANNPYLQLLRKTFANAVDDFNKTCESPEHRFIPLERQDCVNEKSLDAFISHYKQYIYKNK